MALRLLAASVYVSALTVVSGCSDRPILGSDTAATTSDSHVRETDAPSTSGTDTGAPGNACDTLGTTPEDAAAPCGLRQVFFAAAESSLDARAECQLIAAAPCFAELGAAGTPFIVKAHASADEVPTEEQAIFLTDRRGQRVKEFLREHGVNPNFMQVISYGNLEASTPSNEADQRVEFVHNDEFP